MDSKTTDQMAPETLEALKGSIAKWERIVADGPGHNGGPHDCPLCLLFNAAVNKNVTMSCAGCPVSKRTHRRFCVESPYQQVENLEDREDEFATEEEFQAEYRAAAQEELNFLKSLLPQESV